MQTNGHDAPSDREWADAPLEVARTQWPGQPDNTIFKLKKQIVRNGRTFVQSVWLNIHQLRGVAKSNLD